MIDKHELLNRLAPILRTNDAYLLQGEDLALVCAALKGADAAEPTVTPEASAPAIDDPTVVTVPDKRPRRA